MGLHRPFEHLKHKLWPKERPGVELAIWLSTTKSQESTQFPCMQAKCGIPLKSSQWRLQLCFRAHCHRRSVQEVMRPQSCESLNCGNFGTKSQLNVAPVERCKVYYKGEGGGFPQVRAVVSLVCSSCLWFILTPNVLQLCTNHFVLVLCRFVWMIEACHFFVVPSQSSSTPLYPSIVLWAKEWPPTPHYSIVFSLGFTIESLNVMTPLWAKCEDETHTPKSGNFESSGTPKNSEFEFRGQNTLHWGVLYTIEKVLKCKCPKWPCMSHLDICKTIYGWMKGRESNWQFDSRPLKVENRLNPGVCRWSATSLESSWQELQLWFKPCPNPSLGREVMNTQSPGSPNRDSFGTPLWESWEKEPFGCSLRTKLQRIL
jgi:hypothetical protein